MTMVNVCYLYFCYLALRSFSNVEIPTVQRPQFQGSEDFVPFYILSWRNVFVLLK